MLSNRGIYTDPPLEASQPYTGEDVTASKSCFLLSAAAHDHRAQEACMQSIAGPTFQQSFPPNVPATATLANLVALLAQQRRQQRFHVALIHHHTQILKV